MSEYDNELQGVLFRNKAKRPDKQDPDYRGNATVNGLAYWLDAWINERKAGGDKFMKIKFRLKDVQSSAAAERPAEPAPAEFNDDIPF